MWVFLDDKRFSPLVVHNDKRGLGTAVGKSKNWVYARNYTEFINIIDNNFDQIDLISFDHDIDSWENLGGVDIEMTGMSAAQYIVSYCMDNEKPLPNWFVHSDNTNGNKNIRTLLMNYMFRVEGKISSMIDAYGHINGEIYTHP